MASDVRSSMTRRLSPFAVAMVRMWLLSMPSGYCSCSLSRRSSLRVLKERISRCMARSLVEDVGEYQGCHNSSIAFDDELGGIDVQFAPGDLFVGHRAAIAPIARGTVADLAEVAPEGDARLPQVLVQHGHHADGEVASDTPA